MSATEAVISARLKKNSETPEAEQHEQVEVQEPERPAGVEERRAGTAGTAAARRRARSPSGRSRPRSRGRAASRPGGRARPRRPSRSVAVDDHLRRPRSPSSTNCTCQRVAADVRPSASPPGSRRARRGRRRSRSAIAIASLGRDREPGRRLGRATPGSTSFGGRLATERRLLRRVVVDRGPGAGGGEHQPASAATSAGASRL